MFGISYASWKEICEMYFHISQNALKAYLQWFPFSKLSERDRNIIEGKKFFDTYIRSGGFVLFPDIMRYSENYIQKGDGSFRNSTLVSPLLFLIIQAIGKEIFNCYSAGRAKDIEVYYAGNYADSRAKYRQDYDEFCKSIKIEGKKYDYFIKTDITNFFGNINVNELVERINQVCNTTGQKISQTQLLLIKELLLFCGNGYYPVIENSMASSYLATVVYLDEIDQELYHFLQKKIVGLAGFRMIRYVDDLYILFSSEKNVDALYKIYNIIEREYSSILKKYGLSLNTSKCTFKRCTEINDSLKTALYDEYANGNIHDLEDLFEG